MTRAVGWAYLALPLVFVLTTRMVDTATMFTLQSDANQTQIINSQFLTNNNTPPTTQFLGVSFDAKTLCFSTGCAWVGSCCRRLESSSPVGYLDLPTAPSGSAFCAFRSRSP